MKKSEDTIFLDESLKDHNLDAVKRKQIDAKLGQNKDPVEQDSGRQNIPVIYLKITDMEQIENHNTPGYINK